MADKQDSGEGLVTTNRKARYDYTILDTYEAGLVLKGTEVKSLRQGKARQETYLSFFRKGLDADSDWYYKWRAYE